MNRFPRLAYRILRSNFGELSYPYRMTFAVTRRCQARCNMCNIWRRPAGDELSQSEIDKFMAGSNHFSWINLTGGEIFLREDIEAILDSIDRHSRQLCLLNFPTNGYDSDRIVAVVRAFVRRMYVPRLMISISLDGPPSLHDRIRGLDGSWERAVATFRCLRELKSRRFSVFLGYTVQAENLGGFDGMLQAVRREVAVTFDEIHVNLAHVSGLYYDNAAFTGLPAADDACSLLGRVNAARPGGRMSPAAFLERRYLSLAHNYLETGAVPLACQAAGASCYIDPAGMVYPCTGFDVCIGSLRESEYDLKRLWRTVRRREVRASVRAASCPGCWTPCEAYQAILANLATGGGKA